MRLDPAGMSSRCGPANGSATTGCCCHRLGPRRLSIPGAELDGIHYLRTSTTATSCARAWTAGGRLAVIGAGWIGCEIAASARQPASR